MGSDYYPGMMGICLILLLLVSCVTAEPLTERERNATLFSGSDPVELKSPDIPVKALRSILNSVSLLQEQDLSHSQDSKAVLGGGWKDVTMPVVITAPGLYRLINDYTAERDELGVSILSSDVYFDGNGHTFTGLAGHESYGVGIRHDTALSNITITNFSTRDCTAGIAFEQVSDLVISGTHHTNGTYGIAGGTAHNLVISNNTITGYPKTGDPEVIAGITVMQGAGVRIEDNMILNLFPEQEESDTTGIALLYSDDLHLIRNQIIGPVSVGISSTASLSDDPISIDISDNEISSVWLMGMNIGAGVGRIVNNSIVHGMVGAQLTMDDTAVINNTIQGAHQRGLVLQGTNMTVSGNALSYNRCNFYIEGQEEEDFLHQIDRTNMLDGRPLIYIRDQNNTTIGPADNPGMILAVRSQNLTIHDVTPAHAMAGIVLINSSDIAISGVRDTESVNGFLASNVNRCSILNTSAYNNSLYGFIVRSSDNVTLDWCHTSGSSGNGFYLLDSQNVVINASYTHVFTPPYREEDAYGAFIDFCRNVSILNSIFSECPNSGISVINSEQVLIRKAHLAENQEHGVTMMQCTNSTIETSHIQNNSQVGIDLSYINGFTLRRNFIEKNADAGLRFLDVLNGSITDNLFSNSQNVGFVWDSPPLVWNTTLTPGDNIVHGPNLGGNFWAAPDGQGFSETHADRGDGICNDSYLIHPDNIDHLPLAIPPDEIIADFSSDKISGVPPLTVRFSDLSTGSPDSWRWTFGDGTRSTARDPVHTYSGIGRYTVTLEAFGENGQGIIRKPAYITVHR